jgi:hypothetical protein
VLVEDLTDEAMSQPVRDHLGTIVQLGEIYKQLDASVGQFGMDTLTISTKALESGSSTDDSTYTSLENELISFGTQRDNLASQIIKMLQNPEFDGQGQAPSLIAQATAFLAQVHTAAQAV